MKRALAHRPLSSLSLRRTVAAMLNADTRQESSLLLQRALAGHRKILEISNSIAFNVLE